MRKPYQIILPILLVCFVPAVARAQSFRVQCPSSTITHPASNPNSPTGDNNSEPPYLGPTTQSLGGNGFLVPTANANGAIKCQQISGGDGYMTEADGTQTFMFAFGPLSGLADISTGHAGTEFPNVFNAPFPGTLVRGDPATTDMGVGGSGAMPWTGYPNPFAPAFTANGAVGLTPDLVNIVQVTDVVEGVPPLAENPLSANPDANSLPVGADYCSNTPGNAGYPGTTASPNPKLVTVYMNAPLGLKVGDQFVIRPDANQKIDGSVTAAGYLNSPSNPANPPSWTITCVNNLGIDPVGQNSYIITYNDPNTNLPSNIGNFNAGTAATLPGIIDGHVDPRPIMDIGVMNGNIPMPLAAFDEDDEFFLTLTNVGMIMRPDLFEQHTVHFHGYPNASSFYDGVPDASIAINIGASFTYYYLAPDAGTYFYHCHITPPEHLQMGMVGQLHVRPRQDRVPLSSVDTTYHGDLYTYLGFQNGMGLPAGTGPDLRTACNPGADILCSATMPAIKTGAIQGKDLLGNNQKYVYNDGDGSTAYDVEYPLQMHGFDPNFHFVGMTFNPEMFVDMKDKYFLLNGRSYPDTVAPGPQATVSSDGTMHYSQPLPSIINIPAGGKAALRLVNLSVTEYHTLASLGIPMKEVGFMAKLLRDQAGVNTEFYTNSITLGGGESLDVILDASDAGCGSPGCAALLYPPKSVFYLFTPQLDHLANDAENFGGLMTEVHICKSVTGPIPDPTKQYPIDTGSTFGNTCIN